jgi:heat shock protein HtpX
LGALTGLLMFIGGLFGGKGGVVIAFLFAIVMNFGAYWFSDKTVLRMYKAQEITESQASEIYALVRNLVLRASMPMPKVYLIPEATPNAFATGRNEKHAVAAVTEGILRILSREELEGVLSHELAHIKNKDILIGSIAATMAGAIAMLAKMAQWAAILGGGSRDNEEEGGSNIVGLILMAVLAPIAATLIQMAVSRSREYLADEGGAKISRSSHSISHLINVACTGSTGATIVN